MNNLENTNVKQHETMTKEQYFKLVEEFKSATKNKEFKPCYVKNWNGDLIKADGEFTFSHYIFYAALRHRNINKTTHSTESDTFKNAKDIIKFYNKYSKSFKFYEKIKKVIPSLTEEQFIEIISKID